MNSSVNSISGKHNPFAFGELAAAVDSTESQREVWLASQFGDDANCGFNESVFIHLKGKLDEKSLEAALNDLRLRHESIQGCFSSDGHQMVFYKDRPIVLMRHDYQAQTESDAQARLKNLCRELVEQPFDLFNGPLARFHLIKFAPEQYSLVLTFHHSVCDGWSLYVIADELGHLYTARLENRPTDLPPAPSFAEYAVWERSEETAQLRADSIKYWQEQYGKGAPSLELPYDNARPKQRSFAALRMDKELPIDLIGQLKKLAATNRSTLISTLMAGFVAYIHRLSGSQEIVLGVPFAGQMAKGDHALVGHCVNIIPLYFKLDGKESFRNLIAMTQQKMLDAFEYQYLTYGTLLQTIEAERDPSKPPLVSVIFNVDQEGEASEAYRDLTMEFGSNPRTFENFDMNMNITLSAKSAVMECTYNTSLWRKSTMERRLTELEVFYGRLNGSVDQALSSIEFILDADRQAIVGRWDNNRRNYQHAGSLHGLIEAAVDKFPNNIAVIAEDKRLTYAELDQQANRLAHYLIAQGVGAETMVPIMVERSLEMVIAINAVLKAGGAYLPLDPEHPLDRVEYILEEAGAKLVLIQQRFDGNLPASIARLAVDTATETLAAYPVTRPAVSIKPDQLAYVIYTSGSTGKPKGVMNEHQAVCNHMMWMDEVYQLKTTDKILQKTPYTFDVSLWELFLPLISGSQLIMAKPGGHKETGYLIDLINRHQMTYVHFVPSMLYLFLQEADQKKCPSIVRVLASGEAVSKDLEQRFVKAFPDVELWNLYGPTEAAIHVTYWLCGQGDASSSVPIGYPLTNTRLYVVDNNLKLQPPGVPGELLLAGVQIARGYVNRPDLTADRFIADPFVINDKPGRVYRTGDLVRLRDDGVVEYIGRNDFQVKLRGQRIELGEIEALISQYPGVTQSVVLAREDRQNDQRLVAYLMTRDGTSPETQAMRDHLRAALPDYMVPSHFVVLDKFPLTSSGKVDRKALPAPVLGEIDESSFALPENPIEEQLVAVWRDILGLEKVGVTNDFFELGGHSLLGTQMFARVKSLFGINIGLRKLFEAPTIRQLAAIIDHETRSGNQQAKIQLRTSDQVAYATSQQQVWYLLEQLEPESFAYNLPASFRLQGNLDLAAMQQTFDTIVSRHGILRTVFHPQGNELLLDTRETMAMDLTPVTLDQYGVDNIDGLKVVLRKEAARLFDINNGPLFKARLIKLKDGDYVLFLLIHHLVFDGWSFDILLKEMCTLYNAYAQGLPSPLPALPVQFSDYALWQKAWVKSDAVAKQLSYWKEQLSGDLPVLALPLDKERPRYQAHRSDGITFHIDEPLLQQLEEFGNRQGATLFMVIIGLYTLLLHRYSRQEDILVSVPVFARNHVEVSGLMGPLINLLVCRFRLKPQRKFSSWLQDVKKVILEAMDNQDVQFETLVETLNPPRDPSRPPLVQTLFSYQDVRNRADQMDGITRTQVDIDRMGVQTDLDVWLKRQVRGLEGGMEFPVELFDKNTVQAFGQNLVSSAEQLAADSDITLAELASASSAEQAQIEQWNSTSVPFTYDQGVVGDIRKVAEKYADKTAVIGTNGNYSYAELLERSTQLAYYLQQQGLQSGQLVGVLLQRDRDLPALLLAIWTLGAAYVPLDPSYPVERVNTILAVANASMVVTDSFFASSAQDFTGVTVLLDRDADLISQVPASDLPQVLSPDLLAYVIFTSGSTGVPKGVEITQGAIQNFLQAVKIEPGFTPDDRLLAITTIAFDISLLELFLPLITGSTLVIATEQQAHDAYALKQLIADQNINVLQATPASWRLLLSSGWQATPGFRGFAGGEKLARDLAAELIAQGIDLWNLYGPTEATVWTSSYQVKANAAGGLPQVFIGRPLTNTQLYILDSLGNNLPVGSYGELWIGGVGLARGYRGDPKQTADRFITNSQGVRLYRTGDYARWTADGVVEFGDRLDNQIKLRGYRIELEEIELRLRSHDAIQDAAVVLQDFGGDDQRLVAHIICKPDEHPTNTELRKHLRGRLPDYMLPQQFNVLTEFPLLPSGKVNRKALAKPVAGGSYESPANVAPTTPTEIKLAAIWQTALKREQVSINDQFLDVGGHSLLALQVIVQIEAAFAVRIAPQEMWVNTLEQLASKIDTVLASTRPPEVLSEPEVVLDEKPRGLLSKLFGRK